MPRRRHTTSFRNSVVSVRARVVSVAARVLHKTVSEVADLRVAREGGPQGGRPRNN